MVAVVAAAAAAANLLLGEALLLVHRQKVCEDLKTSEINEAQAVAARSEAERFAEASESLPSPPHF